MSYKITRLERRLSTENEQEIFIQMMITDDLGTYPFAGWIHPEDVDAILAEIGEKNATAWSRYGEFKFLCPDGNKALDVYISEILPYARQQQQDNIVEKQIDQAKRLNEAQGIDPVALETIKTEIRSEIMKDIADGKIG